MTKLLYTIFYKYDICHIYVVMLKLSEKKYENLHGSIFYLQNNYSLSLQNL